jgi:hypothetical protein
MGRRRNGKRRKRNSEAAQAAAKISSANLEKRFADTLKYQQDKSAQSEYLSTIAEVEKDILSRTVYVTQVKDLKQESNLTELKRFFEINYGRVEECVRAPFTGKKGKRNHNFPHARVRFVLKEDAEKIFGGKELLLARTEGPVDITACSVAHGKAIKVRPSDQYPNMAKESLSESHLEFNASTIALGHWFSASGEDSYRIVSPGEEQGRATNVWLEEIKPSCFASVKIDLRKRAVEIELHTQGGELTRFMALLAYHTRDVIAFRFKDLLGPIEFIPAKRALFFRLKHPPKLYKVTTYLSQDWDDERHRDVELPGVETCYFGGCLGYKLKLDATAISRLQANKEAMEKIRRFGIWEDGSTLDSVSSVRLSASQKAEHDQKLNQIRDFKAGEYRHCYTPVILFESFIKCLNLSVFQFQGLCFVRFWTMDISVGTTHSVIEAKAHNYLS